VFGVFEMGRSPLRNALNHPDLVSQKFATIPSDTGHSIHDEKNPYADHSDGVSSIDAAKRPVEGPQKSSYIMEETVPLNYDTFLQDNEHQQRAGCRGFPALCFPPNTLAVNPEHLMTEALDRRKVASFQAYMDTNEEHFISALSTDEDDILKVCLHILH